MSVIKIISVGQTVNESIKISNLHKMNETSEETSQLDNVDESFTNSPEWAKNFEDDLIKFSKCAINEWCNIVGAMGLTEEERSNWMKSFDNQIKKQYEDFILEITEIKGNTVKKINNWLMLITKFEKILGIKSEVTQSEHDHLGLSQVHEMVKKEYERLKNIIDERKTTYKNLVIKIEKQCNELENDFKLHIKNIDETTVPSQEMIHNLETHLEQLEQERFSRYEVFISLQENIKSIVQRLGYEPKTNIEANILQQNSPNVSKSFITAMKEFQSELGKLEANTIEEINSLRKEIESLWIMLEESQTHRHAFNENINNFSLTTLRTLREEYQRCQHLKKENMKDYIKKLRTELQELWNKCYCSPNLSETEWFKTECYTEDCFQIHEMNLKKWKEYYQENEELIMQIENHKKYWRDLLDLEKNNDNGLERYKNRGGKLLKEEKVRNKLIKNIPLLEEKMINLAENYETQNREPFLIFGSTVQEYLDVLHEQRDQERKLKLSSKKQTPAKTPGKSGLGTYPSSSRINLFPTPATPKRKLHEKDNNRILQTSPEKRLKTESRNLLALPKSVKKCVNKMNTFKSKENVFKVDDLENYSSFENSFCRKLRGRSSSLSQLNEQPTERTNTKSNLTKTRNISKSNNYLHIY